MLLLLFKAIYTTDIFSFDHFIALFTVSQPIKLKLLKYNT